MKKVILTIFILIATLVVAGLIFVKANSLSSGNDYMLKSDIADALRQLEVTEEDGVKKFGSGSLRREGGNNILCLKGTPYEMGYQHGRLLADEIKGGCATLFSDPISHNPLYAKKPKWMRKLLLKYLEVKVYAPVENNTPREYLEEIKGIADGAGLDYRDVFIGNFY